MDNLLQFAHGSYQRALLTGRARWSGADLRGKARDYGGRYAASRNNLIRRIQAAGIPARVVPIGPHGRLTLVIN